MKRTTKLLAAATTAVAVAAGGSAFTASSGVSAHKLGQGVGTITGYVTSGVAYTYDTDGTTITNVVFTLDAAATTVKSRVTSSAASTSYVSCTDNGTTTTNTLDWTCDVADVTVANASGLDVFASSI
jgi:hypothetical protein